MPRTYTESQAFFEVLIHRRLTHRTTFASGVFHAYYLYLKKEKWNGTKKLLVQQNAILLLDSNQNT